MKNSFTSSGRSSQGSEKPRLFKKPKHFKKSPTQLVSEFWALLGFRIFYLNKQLESLLVDLAHQLSFYLDVAAL